MSKQEEIDRLVEDIERFVTERRALTRELEDVREQVAALESAQAERVRFLKMAAAGRREYASTGSPSQHVMTDVEILNAEAQNFESALKIVQGDLSPLYGLLPSWMWEEAGLE